MAKKKDKKKDKKKAKAAKPAKKSASRPKAKPAKAVKKAKAKTAKKSAPKKAAKKVVKKAAKPAKKIVKKVVKKKAAPKPARKAKPVKKAVKKVVKPVKKAAPKKVLKKVVAKPVAKKAAEKPAKAAKVLVVKPAKAEKISSFKEKPLKPRGKGGRKPKNKNGDDEEPEIVHDELIEEIIKTTTKRQPKAPKVPKMIKTFVNPHESLTNIALPEPGKKGIPKKEPKGKFELEYVVRTSAGILFELLTTPSGLSEWFADDVNIRDGIFTFFWDGSEQKAKLLAYKEEKYLRLSWLDKPDGYYFEFRVEKDELTGDISLMIIDFADEASDMQTSKLLWDSQVNKLLNVLGSN